MNLVTIKPLISPHTVPTKIQSNAEGNNGSPAFDAKQVKLADKQTIEPTEISISPIIKINTIGNIINTSARYFGISLKTFLS